MVRPALLRKDITLIREVRQERHANGQLVNIHRALPIEIWKSIAQFHKRATAGRWTGWTKMPPLEADFM